MRVPNPGVMSVCLGTVLLFDGLQQLVMTPLSVLWTTMFTLLLATVYGLGYGHLVWKG